MQWQSHDLDPMRARYGSPVPQAACFVTNVLVHSKILQYNIFTRMPLISRLYNLLSDFPFFVLALMSG